MGPSPRSHSVPSLQQRPRPQQPHLPDPSLGARSSHRVSQAGVLQGPPEPTPRRSLNRGAGLGSKTGDAAALWWAEAGRGGEPWRGIAAAEARAPPGGGAGREPGSGFSGPPRRDVGKRLGALRRACLTHPGAGESGLDRVEGGDRVPLHALTVPEAALLNAATASSSPETQRVLHGSSPEHECRAGDKAEAPKGREQGPLETPLDPKEDVPCSTCSSSSDSEPEGFFLGQRLPRPCKTPGSLQAGDSNNPRKHCTIC